MSKVWPDLGPNCLQRPNNKIVKANLLFQRPNNKIVKANLLSKKCDHTALSYQICAFKIWVNVKYWYHNALTEYHFLTTADDHGFMDTDRKGNCELILEHCIKGDKAILKHVFLLFNLNPLPWNKNIFWLNRCWHARIQKVFSEGVQHRQCYFFSWGDGERIEMPIKVGHHWSTSKTPLKWHFAGVLIMAHHGMLAW